mgnify:CR=1 FL=1
MGQERQSSALWSLTAEQAERGLVTTEEQDKASWPGDQPAKVQREGI